MTFALWGRDLHLIVQDDQFDVDVQFGGVDLNGGQVVLGHLHCVPVQRESTRQYKVIHNLLS